ncbi:MAG: hypothetical protein JWM98_890 [Thermoleophilia bacterium]|nr:hypothetical protein [Thermoleophilia bacterium]
MAAPAPAAAPIADLEQVRFDRALEELQDSDPAARVALDSETGLAVGVDTEVRVAMPAAARALPASDRSAASAVLFLDRFGALFGVAGWHVLEPRFASPIGSSIWFTFAVASPRRGEFLINVCAQEDTVRHVRVERTGAAT